MLKLCSPVVKIRDEIVLALVRHESYSGKYWSLGITRKLDAENWETKFYGRVLPGLECRRSHPIFNKLLPQDWLDIFKVIEKVETAMKLVGEK